MSYVINYVAGTGKAFSATYERVDAGLFWNPTTEAWEVGPSMADKQISLAEGALENVGSYSQELADAFGTYTVLERIHDLLANSTVVRTQYLSIVEGGIPPATQTVTFNQQDVR